MDQYPSILASVQTQMKRMGPAQGMPSLNIKHKMATMGTEGTKKQECHRQKNPEQLLCITRAATELSANSQGCLNILIEVVRTSATCPQAASWSTSAKDTLSYSGRCLHLEKGLVNVWTVQAPC